MAQRQKVMAEGVVWVASLKDEVRLSSGQKQAGVG